MRERARDAPSASPSKLGRRGFGSALLFALLVLGATSRAATQATDGIILESPRVDPGRALNCTKNEKVYEVASLLIRANGSQSGDGGGNALWRPENGLSLSELCELQGVTCLRNCSVFSKEDLLAPLCNETSGPSWSPPTFGSDRFGSADLRDLLSNSTNRAQTLISYCVTELNLGGFGLNGDLKSFGWLTGLRRLNLTDNNITGTLGDLSSLTKLEMLDVNKNRIEGNFTGVSNPSLKSLYAEYNNLTGTLSGVENLKSLELLDLTSNKIGGTIDYLSPMDDLNNVILWGNKLTGNIDAMKNMSKLLVLNAGYNNLSGALPQDDIMDSVVVLVITNNNFGKVGNSLVNMRNIQFVDLSANNFTDKINDLLDLSSGWIGSMDLRRNDFQGVIQPDSLNDIENLDSFYLDENPKVTGRLVPDLDNFQRLLCRTKNQFIYYNIDDGFFSTIEATDSPYFKVARAFISLDPGCTDILQWVTTLQFQVEIPREAKKIYFCFAEPRGKFMLDFTTKAAMKFNITYHAQMNSCGVKAKQEGQGLGGQQATDGDFIAVSLPVSTCNPAVEDYENNIIKLLLMIRGTYADGTNRGNRQDFTMNVKIKSEPLPLNTGAELATFISLVVIFSLLAMALAIVVIVTVRMYFAYQKEQKYGKMKKNAESAFVKSRAKAKLQLDKDSCIVFTDIQNSTVLRDTSSQLYNKIILVHDGVIRKLAARLGGLELATEGDGFVIWFNNVPNATIFCMELQHELMECSWSPKVTKLCNMAYGESNTSQKNVRSKTFSSLRSQGSENSQGSKRDQPTLWRRIQKKYAKILFRTDKEKCFNGPRVRCGVHVVRSGMNTIKNQTLGVYSFSGPDFEHGRKVCDMGHGGQVLVSEQAQSVILDSLNETHFPQIWHWGGYTFDDEDNAEIHHIYEVAPSQGVLKRRNFESLRGHIQVAYPPGVHMSTRKLPTEDAIIVSATVKDAQLSKAAYGIADSLISDMQQRFWGWRIVPEDMVRSQMPGRNSKYFSRPGRTSVSQRSTSYERSQSLGKEKDATASPSRGSDRAGTGLGLIEEHSFQQHDTTERWFFAFAKPEDALRFALCCQLELVYANWPKHIKDRFKKELTAEKAPLWNGLPVAFAVHVSKFPAFDHAKSLELMPQKSFDMRPPSKKNLTLCNPSKNSMLSSSRATVSQAMSILDNIALDGQVVVTSDLIQSMQVPMSSIGDPVVEHLGRVAVKEFKSSVDVYQVLPVELAGRRFPNLADTMVSGHLLSVGARRAPEPKIGLSFVFVFTVSRDEGSQDGHGRAIGAFSSSSIFDGEQLQVLLSKYGGYLVDEVSMSNMVLAFEEAVGAALFCAAVQRSLAVCKRRLSEAAVERASGEAMDFAGEPESGNVGEVGAGRAGDSAANLLRDPGEAVTKGIKMGIASIRTTAEVRDVYLGIDTTTGRRRYGTPVLNMASRVAKSAATGQILMVGGVRAKDASPWGSGKRPQMIRDIENAAEEHGVRILDHGYHRVRGFGETPRLLYELRCAEAEGWCLAESGFQGDYIEPASTGRRSSFGGSLSLEQGKAPSQRPSKRKALVAALTGSGLYNSDGDEV